MGSTVTHFVVVKLPQDHPHIHGEHLAISVVVINPGGSPPYTWGAQEFVPLWRINRGITPIYMGSTDALIYSPVDWLGSPPYTWGAQTFWRLVIISARITPIYMGSTSGAARRCGVRKDHPHIHGEHPNVPVVFFNFVGSPPYTWGALSGVPRCPGRARITPIYMGSTICCLASIPNCWDHPHIHGEHSRSCTSRGRSWGSPPYTWGAPTQAGNAL